MVDNGPRFQWDCPHVALRSPRPFCVQPPSPPPLVTDACAAAATTVDVPGCQEVVVNHHNNSAANVLWTIPGACPTQMYVQSAPAPSAFQSTVICLAPGQYQFVAQSPLGATGYSDTFTVALLDGSVEPLVKNAVLRPHRFNANIVVPAGALLHCRRGLYVSCAEWGVSGAVRKTLPQQFGAVSVRYEWCWHGQLGRGCRRAPRRRATQGRIRMAVHQRRTGVNPPPPRTSPPSRPK